MKLHSVALVALMTAAAGLQVAAQTIARTEIHPIESVTLTTSQILHGDLNGKGVALAGELRIPRPGTDRLPAVILLHGSGGIGPNIDIWAKEINSLGVAVFLLDSFSGRGIVSTITDQSQLDSLAMMTDAYRALATLSKNPRIDPSRIAIMGFSKGAVAAVYSSNTRMRMLYAPTGPGFAAHIGLYTPCGMQFSSDDQVTGAPIRLFHGTPDDWVPVAPCREYVGRLKKAGADVTLTEFSGAFHAYDNPATPAVIMYATAQTTRNCRWQEDDKDRMVNVTTGIEYTAADPCIERGAHIGYNQAATEATIVAVRSFFKSLFKI